MIYPVNDFSELRPDCYCAYVEANADPMMDIRMFYCATTPAALMEVLLNHYLQSLCDELLGADWFEELDPQDNRQLLDLLHRSFNDDVARDVMELWNLIPPRPNSRCLAFFAEALEELCEGLPNGARMMYLRRLPRMLSFAEEQELELQELKEMTFRVDGARELPRY